MISLTDYNDFFIFLGGLLIIGGAVYFLFGHRLQNIFIEEEEISRLKNPDQTSTHKILLPGTFRNVNLRFSLLSKILLAIIIGGFLFNQFLMWKMGSSGILNKLFSISISITKK